jgi:hypothetical protein
MRIVLHVKQEVDDEIADYLITLREVSDDPFAVLQTAYLYGYQKGYEVGRRAGEQSEHDFPRGEEG